MTIKVILRNDFVDPPQRLTCVKCKSILEYERADCRYDFRDNAVWVDCPVCKHPNDVKEKK